ncbi:MAG TPA: LysR family transcriptional regulator, partial [Acidiferrobacterales bacterium]|nr:LysR family transcriptional regulator [Acidiferrobacterales bacterium]
ASRELHVSQSSISQQLKLLEEEYEVKLYNKIGRGIELTEKGRLLLIDVKPILDQIKKLKEKYNNKERHDPTRPNEMV